ncbi:MAG: GGDEF domain-containing protein [Nitrococcus sp.]|nr:GGDEF domain-containing protein [Nitrococcus sp.]
MVRYTYWVLRWRLREFMGLLRAVHSEPYLRAKASEFGRFTGIASFLTAFFVATTWFWDYVVDPLNATDTIALRIAATLVTLVAAALLYRDVRSLGARVALLLAPLCVDGILIEVLSRLEQGPEYGMGTFLYFFIFMPFTCLAQSLRFNVLALTAIALFPTLLHALGFAAHLNMPVYHMYIWMLYGPIVMLVGLFDVLYWRIYCYASQLEQIANTDELTQLPNRRHFLEASQRLLRLAQRDGQSASLLFIDIDHFKALNDLHGHVTGDSVLKEVAGLLVPMIRSTDVIARYGGEEFVVYLHNADETQGAKIAEGIRQRVSAQTSNGLSVTVSIGVAANDNGYGREESIHALIHQADLALYAAKRQGRNRVVAHEARGRISGALGT